MELASGAVRADGLATSTVGRAQKENAGRFIGRRFQPRSHLPVAGLLSQFANLTPQLSNLIEELVDMHSWLVSNGIPLIWFREVQADLEDVFMTITKGEVA